MSSRPTTPDSPARVSLSEVVAALSNAVGEEKAEAAVTEVAAAMGERGPELSRDAALAILETIAETPGLLGVTARFARTRLLLRWASTILHRTGG